MLGCKSNPKMMSYLPGFQTRTWKQPFLVYFNRPIVYDRSHYFGLGPIPKQKPKLADIFCQYRNWYRNLKFKENDGRSIQLGLKNIDNFFLPDFYIYNLLDFKQSEFADPLKAILLTPEGKIW